MPKRSPRKFNAILTIAAKTVNYLATTLSPAAATQHCDKAECITDVTVRDGMVPNPNENFR